MDRILKPNLTQINNVALGQPFNCELPIGPAYRYLDIIVTMTTASGLAATLITDFLDLITLSANGKPFRTFLATEANDIHTLYGSVYAALICKSSGSSNTLAALLTSTTPTTPANNAQATCIFRIYFEEPWRKNWAAASSRKFFTSWPAMKPGAPSQVLSSFQIQGLIPSTTNNAAATALSVLIYAGTDSSQGPTDKAGNPITNTLKWYRYPGFTYTASGDQPMNNLVKYDKGKVLAILEQMDIYSQSAGDDVGRLQVNADGRIVYDATHIVNMDELVRHGFNPKWNLDQYHYVADANDQITDGLVLSTAGGAYVNTLTATATLTAAAGSNKTLVAISQVYGPLD